MATTIYATATDHINKHPYDVMVQAHFAGIHRLVEQKIFLSPIYEAFDSNALQKSKITIAKMVELFISKSSFNVIEDKDVLYILHQIDCYVEEVYHLKNDDKVQKYIEQILKLRERIYFLFRRVLNLHPQWKQAYQQQIGVFQIISQLYGKNHDLPETLLEDLRICPTIKFHEKSKKLNTPLPPHGQIVYDV